MIRENRPNSNDKYFITKGNGGLSSCIQGNPTDAQCDVLSNCVGYACGAFNETCENGYEKYYLNCNAEYFIERAISLGLSISKEPVIGGIIVYGCGSVTNGNDGAGHVEHVIRYLDRDTIETRASNYGGTTFYKAIRKRGNGNWGLNSPMYYRGCVVNPKIGFKGYEEPVVVDLFPGISDEDLAKKVWLGEFGNGDTRKQKLGIRYDAVQTLVDSGYGKPEAPAPIPTPVVEQVKPIADILDLVRRTIRGDFGNGQQRVNALGENYKEVQKQVNINISAGNYEWDKIKLY